jgi:hypothetical protein
MSRDELYRLIDTLPEAALEHAKGMLDHLQTWPPQPPPEIDRIRRQLQERMHQVARPGFAMAGGSGGSYTLGAGGHVRNGHHSFAYPENGAAVRETHHFHEGLEITITERNAARRKWKDADLRQRNRRAGWRATHPGHHFFARQ